MLNRSILIIWVLVQFQIIVNAQVSITGLVWNFGTSPTGTLAPSNVPASMTASDMSASGIGLVYTNGSTNLGLFGDDWDESISSATAFNNYFQFTVTPATGSNITITGINFFAIFTSNGNNDGPNNVVVRYGFGVNPSTWILSSNTQVITAAFPSPNPYSFPVSSINNITTPITFQIGAWRTDGSQQNTGIIIDEVKFSTGSALPIELTTFTATPVPTGIALKWRTASEINNAYVAVERSTDGNRYDEISRVPGQGDSFEPREYAHVDESPEKGINYYRLRQVDYDGSENYSPVVQATFGKAGKLRLYPSPAVDRLTVTLAETEKEPVRWEVYDASGRLVKSGMEEADQPEFPVELLGLPEGVYTLQVMVGREVFTERFVKK